MPASPRQIKRKQSARYAHRLAARAAVARAYAALCANPRRDPPPTPADTLTLLVRPYRGHFNPAKHAADPRYAGNSLCQACCIASADSCADGPQTLYVNYRADSRYAVTTAPTIGTLYAYHDGKLRLMPRKERP